jgi:DNA-binding MltR family transcriptional regulator
MSGAAVTDPAALRLEHDEMLTRLSRRHSTVHFAHGAVAIFVAAILGGAAYRLSVDTEFAWAPRAVVPVAVVSGLALAYMLVRFSLGLGVLSREVKDFDHLRSLRRELKLDELPSLPSSP